MTTCHSHYVRYPLVQWVKHISDENRYIIKEKGKEEHLYSAFLQPIVSKRSDMNHTVLPAKQICKCRPSTTIHVLAIYKGAYKHRPKCTWLADSERSEYGNVELGQIFIRRWRRRRRHITTSVDVIIDAGEQLPSVAHSANPARTSRPHTSNWLKPVTTQTSGKALSKPPSFAVGSYCSSASQLTPDPRGAQCALEYQQLYRGVWLRSKATN